MREPAAPPRAPPPRLLSLPGVEPQRLRSVSRGTHGLQRLGLFRRDTCDHENPCFLKPGISQYDLAWKIRLGTEERGKDFWDPQPLPVIQWLMGGFGLCRVSPWLAVSRGR